MGTKKWARGEKKKINGLKRQGKNPLVMMRS